mmetsp:Transcript_26294/g.83534  ORF Transcript_26294/g.83534 Transcript_26294/m.83534 type:complete len:409 (+) Transcript_26294:1710-2936(+)
MGHRPAHCRHVGRHIRRDVLCRRAPSGGRLRGSNHGLGGLHRLLHWQDARARNHRRVGRRDCQRGARLQAAPRGRDGVRQGNDPLQGCLAAARRRVHRRRPLQAGAWPRRAHVGLRVCGSTAWPRRARQAAHRGARRVQLRRLRRWFRRRRLQRREHVLPVGVVPARCTGRRDRVPRRRRRDAPRRCHLATRAPSPRAAHGAAHDALLLRAAARGDARRAARRGQGPLLRAELLLRATRAGPAAERCGGRGAAQARQHHVRVQPLPVQRPPSRRTASRAPPSRRGALLRRRVRPRAGRGLRLGGRVGPRRRTRLLRAGQRPLDGGRGARQRRVRCRGRRRRGWRGALRRPLPRGGPHCARGGAAGPPRRHHLGAQRRAVAARRVRGPPRVPARRPARRRALRRRRAVG